MRQNVQKGSCVTELKRCKSFQVGAGKGGVPQEGIEAPSSYKRLSHLVVQFSSVLFSCSVMSDSLRPHESQHARLPCPSPTPWSSIRLTSIESVMPSSHLILCRPSLLLPPIPPSIKVFSSESSLHMIWPKYWSFSFSIIPSKEIPGLISFRMDWLDLLAVQGTLKSLLQHHSSKHQFFGTQLSLQSNSHIHP